MAGLSRVSFVAAIDVLLRSNLRGEAQLWHYYLQLTEIEQAFKELKNDLAIRPIYHQKAVLTVIAFTGRE
ncbi:MAG: hypothetical protein ACRED0_09660 [Gammaproteobacteria bacterium]